MEAYLGMLGVVAGIFLLVGIGAGTRRLGWLTEEADRSLLNLVVRVLVPALILSVTLGSEHLLRPQNLILPPAFGFGSIMVGFAVAWLAARWLSRRVRLTDGPMQRTFAFCVGLHNYGYIPLPLATLLFDRETLAVLFVHNLGVELGVWTVGIMLLSGSVGGQWHRRLLNAPTVAIIASLAITFAGLHVYIPQFVYQALAMLGGSAIPLSLVMIGATMADELERSPLRQGGRAVALGSILRLGLLPALMIGTALLLPATSELKQVIAIQAAMPSATFPIILARVYGGHPATALRLAFGTSLISLITMPLWLSAGLRLLGV
jgi:malate permease and related proteins